MDSKHKEFWRVITGRGRQAENDLVIPEPTENQTVGIAPNDPLLAYLAHSPGLVEIEKLTLASPALEAMKAAGVKIAVPLISQGELIGLLNLGPRMSEQEYNPDDTRLLVNLASQAAPALRVAQLARQQQAEARERERIEQELRVASIIQHTLLPKEVPSLEGWQIDTHYQPARFVGGDFYDFIHFPDGRLGLVIGDVTDKGVPAAMVMATTRGILRAAAERLIAPGKVLERVNNTLVPDIPANMFVTCLYALLEPKTGSLCYANAGHDLPYQRVKDGINELRATGMPLGLMPDMLYEEKQITMEPGDTILFYSDGLVEAHNPAREMFGFPRLRGLIASHTGGADLIEYLLAELDHFTGADWEQEDDVAFVTLQRSPLTTNPHAAPSLEKMETAAPAWKTLTEFKVDSQPGNERQAIDLLTEAVKELGLPDSRLERLKTAVGEATMNAMEHGNKYQDDLPVFIEVLTSSDGIAVQITDQGGDIDIPEAETPDLEAKLEGQQSPRGWGLFLIKNMVDEMQITRDKKEHTIQLVLHWEGDGHAANATTA
jgi:serine phosphatase RsbU (regulator of sigma subunit)/anti-sigma regulatory factor (Ser/Thr protein kinase)